MRQNVATAVVDWQDTKKKKLRFLKLQCFSCVLFLTIKKMEIFIALQISYLTSARAGY